MDSIKATVAIITCQRPLWLNRTLKGLNNQSTPKNTSVDILVVDNASDAITEAVVKDIAKVSPFNVTYCTEKTKGIVAARNKCVEVFLFSDSDFLIFIDDDEWPENNEWINKLIQAQKKYNADIITSHVVSVGENDTPSWAVKLIYGKNPFKEGQKTDVFYTNNLLISRKVLEQVAPAFDSRFALTGASDYHFSLRCKHSNYKAFYTNAPVVEEFPKSRATIKWFLRRGFRSGIGYTRSHLFEEKPVKAVFRCLLMSCVRFARGILYLLKGGVTFNKTTSVNGLFRICSAIGTIVGLFGIKHNEYSRIHGQ